LLPPQRGCRVGGPGLERAPGFLFELAILGYPFGIERRIEHLLQLGASFPGSSLVEQQLGEEEVRGGAVRIVGQRLSQVRFGKPAAAAKEPRHLEIPAAERAVGGALLKRRIQAQHRLERVLDRLAVLEPLPDAERFGKGAHVGGEPEVPFGTVRLKRGRLAAGVDAALEKSPALRLGRVPTQPIVGASELPGRVETSRIRGQHCGPEVGRAARARQAGAIGIDRVGRLSTRKRDIE
jgi:hypothetical protein